MDDTIGQGFQNDCLQPTVHKNVPQGALDGIVIQLERRLEARLLLLLKREAVLDRLRHRSFGHWFWPFVRLFRLHGIHVGV